MARLLGPNPGDAREIDRSLILGREGADVVLSDPEVSRRHASVAPTPHGIEVEDLGSRNGTFVDGSRITGKLELSSPATLRVGKTELQVEMVAAGTTAVRSAVPPVPDERQAMKRDVTVQRQAMKPDVTVQREAGAAGAAAGTGTGGDAGAEKPRRRRKRMLVLGGAGLLLLAGIAGAVIALTGGSGTQAVAQSHCDARFPKLIKDGFPEPPLVFSHDGLLRTTLTATTTLTTVNLNTYQGMQYDGRIPGPTYVVCPGDLFQIDLQNKLPLPTNLHVHGLHVSPEGNGDDIFVTINPLQSRHYSYRIPLDQSPGSFWYHPHYHPLVDPETTAGLIGAIVVEGGLDKVMPDIPQRLIVIHGGKPFPLRGVPLPIPGTRPGQVKPPPNPGPAELLVNGAYNPTLHIRPGEIQRWRIFNATGTRELNMALPGVTFQLLAQDGNTLQYMRPERNVLIGAGSRVEVLVRGQAPGSYPMESLPFQPCFKSCFDPFGGIPQNGARSSSQPLLTVVSSGTAVNDRMPSILLDPHPPDLRRGHVDVYRTLQMVRRPSANGAPTFPYNGKLFNPNRVDVTMKLNSVEQWTLVNPITGVHDEWHTFHIHQNPFQIISINGKPVNYIDWQDNVNLAPGSRVVIRMHPIDFTGKFVFHCHLTFHEDNGMMATVQVLAHPTPSQVQAGQVIYMSPPSNGSVGASASLWAHTPAARRAAGTGLGGLLYYCNLLGHSV